MKHAREDYNRIQDPAGLIPEDEPVFLLRAKDRYAPEVVLHWAERVREEGGEADIVTAAISQAFSMMNWQQKHGCQMPDLPTELQEAAGDE